MTRFTAFTAAHATTHCGLVPHHALHTRLPRGPHYLLPAPLRHHHGIPLDRYHRTTAYWVYVYTTARAPPPAHPHRDMHCHGPAAGRHPSRPLRLRPTTRTTLPACAPATPFHRTSRRCATTATVPAPSALLHAGITCYCLLRLHCRRALPACPRLRSAVFRATCDLRPRCSPPGVLLRRSYAPTTTTGRTAYRSPPGFATHGGLAAQYHRPPTTVTTTATADTTTCTWADALLGCPAPAGHHTTPALHPLRLGRLPAGFKPLACHHTGWVHLPDYLCKTWVGFWFTAPALPS